MKFLLPLAIQLAAQLALSAVTRRFPTLIPRLLELLQKASAKTDTDKSTPNEDEK